MSTRDDCDCEFDPYDDPEDEDDESYHYRRTCEMCGEVWWSLHCVHDGIQNPCPQCGWTFRGRPTPIERLYGGAPPADR